MTLLLFHYIQFSAAQGQLLFLKKIALFNFQIFICRLARPHCSHDVQTFWVSRFILFYLTTAVPFTLAEYLAVERRNTKKREFLEFRNSIFVSHWLFSSHRVSRYYFARVNQNPMFEVAVRLTTTTTKKRQLPICKRSAQVPLTEKYQQHLLLFFCSRSRCCRLSENFLPGDYSFVESSKIAATRPTMRKIISEWFAAHYGAGNNPATVSTISKYYWNLNKIYKKFEMF